ncbi:MAG: transporter [Paracoccaceae bacterium]
MSKVSDRLIAAVTVAALCLATTAAAGVGDGPRAYQNAPVGTQMLIFSYMKQDSGFNIDGSPSEPATRIDADIVVLQFTKVVDIGGNAAGLFVIAPMGRVTGNLLGPTKQGKSSGVGDLQFGMVLGLVGSPALTPKEYSTFSPGFSLGILAKLAVPTGAYSSSKTINFGTNRYALQIGAPMTWNLRDSFLPGNVTTLEFTPSIWLYSDNTSPTGGADRQSRKPLYSLETHLTHDFSKRIWGSLDAVYAIGGATTTDGSFDANAIEAVGVGATIGVALNNGFGLQMSYGKTPKSNTDGLKDNLFRVKFMKVF